MKRRAIIILIIALFSNGCAFFGIGSGREEMTTEASFEQIRVQAFAQNRLVFEGTRRQETSHYIYDMNQKKLSQGSVRWQQEQDRIHYLGGGGTIALQLDDGVDRLVWTDRNGHEQELAHTTSQRLLKFSVAPNDGSLVYWIENGSGGDFFIYDLEREKETFVASFTQPLHRDDIAWSVDGRYVMVLGQHVFQVPSGKDVWEVTGEQAVWSPVAPELLVLKKSADSVQPPKGVDIRYGHRIVKIDMQVKEEEQLFPQETTKEETTSYDDAVDASLEPPPLILDELVWDERGQLFAFLTGWVSEDQVHYEKVHVMDAQGGFHLIENEQNLRPSAIEGLSFSPDGDFFSYTAAGLLKVLYLPTQQSKIFDVFTQMQQEDSQFLEYSRNDVWVLSNNEIKRLGKGLEEKTVYRSPYELMQFFVSTNGQELLVIEREDDQYLLKLVSLLEEETGTND